MFYDFYNPKYTKELLSTSGYGGNVYRDSVVNFPNGCTYCYSNVTQLLILKRWVYLFPLICFNYLQ